MMLRTQKVKLYPNQTMKKVLDDLCDYRRYCWNQGLALWNDMYDASVILADKKQRPNERKVRDELVANKADWQFQLSARCLQLAISDLGKAWQNFFDQAQPDWGKPHFKSKKAPRQGFKTDRAKLVNGRLRLDKPHEVKETWSDIKFKGAHNLTGELKVVSIYRENGQYWASLPFEVMVPEKTKTGVKTAVDVNVGHLDYTAGRVNTLPSHLQKIYQRIKHYQRVLAHKCKANVQHDLMQKFTTQLVNDYDQIVIEDLAVKKMQMSHVAAKGLQRSMFGYFRQILTYKCEWYGKTLRVADRFYPSTQRCSVCGHVKQGDDKVTLAGNHKHHTKHDEYICYQCGAILDRDENAVANLLALL